ncbi:hypothetical protein ES703_82528 [subsurface metagenome]
MERNKIIGCIFEDTPKECSQIINNECVGLGKFTCLFNHTHLAIVEEAKEGLIELLRKEMDTPRRYKHLSGLAGRPGQES